MTADENGVRQLCPLCDSAAYAVAWRSELRQFGECLSCGMAYVRPFEWGDASEVGAAASSVTKARYLNNMKRNAAMRGKVAAGMAARRLKAYQAILGRRPATVCEIGAGDGAFCPAYEELNVTYVGVDVNREIVERAQALRRNVLLGGPEVVADKGSRFDVVFLSQVLEHVLQPLAFLKEIRVMMADDGIVHIDVPNHNSLSSWLRRIRPGKEQFGFLQPPHHQIAYTADTLSLLLNRAGLDPVWLTSRGNLDSTWGQLILGSMNLSRAGLLVAGFLKMGSLLVALAGKSKVGIQRET